METFLEGPWSQSPGWRTPSHQAGHLGDCPEDTRARDAPGGGRGGGLAVRVLEGVRPAVVVTQTSGAVWPLLTWEVVHGLMLKEEADCVSG